MKNITLALVLLVTTLSFAQTSENDMFILEHVSLNVEDVDVSAQFYTETFGLSEIKNRGEKPGIRWFSLGNDRELHLISTVKGEVRLNKAAHFAVTAIDFEGFVMRIKKAKIPHQDWAGIPNTVSLRPDGVKQVCSRPGQQLD